MLNTAVNTKPTHPHAEIVQQICEHIDQHFHENLTLQCLSELFHLSPFHLQRVFKRIMGITPREYADSVRYEMFKQQLREGESVTDAIYGAGYSSTSRLYERSDSQLGMTPSDYKKGGEGMTIKYSMVSTSLGSLLVASTEKGICRVCLDDDPDAQLIAMVKEFHSADNFVRDDEGLGQAVASIINYLNGEEPHLDLTLDVRATAWQRRVWKALQDIPYGETRTYTDIATAIGKPTARRAVANACAKNPVALIIPCHRVIRKDGELGGYKWGIERKQSLLQTEQAHHHD